MQRIEKIESDNKGQVIFDNKPYSFEENIDGSILLKSLFTEIDFEDSWLAKDAGALAKVKKGLEQSAAGQASKLMDFKEFLEMDLDEDED